MKYIIGIIVVILIGLTILSIIEDKNRTEWLNHHCKEIGIMSGSSTTGVGVSGNGTVSVVPVFISGKTGYQCDDGKQYWE